MVTLTFIDVLCPVSFVSSSAICSCDHWYGMMCYGDTYIHRCVVPSELRQQQCDCSCDHWYGMMCYGDTYIHRCVVLGELRQQQCDLLMLTIGMV